MVLIPRLSKFKILRITLVQENLEIFEEQLIHSAGPLVVAMLFHRLLTTVLAVVVVVVAVLQTAAVEKTVVEAALAAAEKETVAESEY